MPRALQSDEISARRDALVHEQEKAGAATLDAVREEIERDPHVALVGGPGTLAVVPARDGQPIDQGNQRRLSTRLGRDRGFNPRIRMLGEDRGAGTVTFADVERSATERDRREERVQREFELIERGILAFEPAGEAVGQLYGIGLIMLADLVFGRPIRVMARAFMGMAGVVNIEREARLSGPIHSKGFLISVRLSGRPVRSRAPADPVGKSLFRANVR